MAFSHDSWRELGLRGLSNEDLLRRFRDETRRGASSGPATYAARLGSAIRRYEVASGQTAHLLDCISNVDTLASVLSCDRSLREPDRQISRRTVKGVLSAFTAFIAWVPLPSTVDRDLLRRNLAESRIRISRRRGLRLVIDRGNAAPAAEVVPPTAADIVRVMEVLSQSNHQLGPVTADLVGTCYLTAIRIGVALMLTRSDLFLGTNRRWFIAVYEKSRSDRRPVLLRVPRPPILKRWAALPEGAPLWQSGGATLSYSIAARLITKAAAEAELPHLTFHHLRHAFATELASVTDLRTVMNAVGWAGEDVAQGYIHPGRADAH